MGFVRRVTLVLSLIGALVFGGLFAATFLDTGRVYLLVEGVAVDQVAKTFPEMVEGLEPSEGGVLSALAGKARDHLSERMAVWEDPKMQAQIEGFVRGVLDLGCEGACAGSEDTASDATSALQSFMTRQIGKQQARLEALVKDKFASAIAGFLTDIRIVSGANVLAFLLAFGLSLRAHAGQRVVLVISACLSLGTVLAIAWYVAQIDLISMLLWGNFLGYGYVTMLGICIGFLLDLALNKGRVTRFVIDMIGNLFSALPS